MLNEHCSCQKLPLSVFGFWWFIGVLVSVICCVMPIVNPKLIWKSSTLWPRFYNVQQWTLWPRWHRFVIKAREGNNSCCLQLQDLQLLQKLPSCSKAAAAHAAAVEKMQLLLQLATRISVSHCAWNQLILRNCRGQRQLIWSCLLFRAAAAKSRLSWLTTRERVSLQSMKKTEAAAFAVHCAHCVFLQLVLHGN